eukprot:CAMPEP_0194476812 /NCGR_PEP_ID=MMETSP0253-20130528/641_1 /TAXON_ID=2966 /ORGANISM="Noctiluca scintillans" /LENGTH=97 /DNA_ID=CAMNT_0039315711 /DNA_START=742 /DNA_END=1035 /DNA_ORIENTATION=-
MLASVIMLSAASSSATTTTTSSSTKNFALVTNQFVKKSMNEELKLTMTIRLCGNGPQDGEMSGFEMSLLANLSDQAVTTPNMSLKSNMDEGSRKLNT